MTPDRSNRIKELFHAALARDETERVALLEAADASVRVEVERLLLESEETTRLAVPAEEWDLSGRTISHYRILGTIGVGGMGVVYKAEDTRLHRTVALKFLRREAVEGEEMKARFLREAQAAAALDHPNICTVHEIDEVDRRTFLAMAYVDGPSLMDKIRERPLKLDEALDIAIQIGEGLQSAHEKGIVHRDIKSGNVMLTSRGQVKLVDFGLAHLAGADRITRSGAVAGTPAYMSPEQVRGEEVDRRTDIWALGVVLYEMVTGRLPFRGDSVQSVALAIQTREPDPLTALRSGVPVELDRIVSKCLDKDLRRRYAHVEELVVDLQRLAARTPSSPAVVVKPRPRTRVWAWTAAALAVLGLAVTVWRAGWLERAPAPPLELKQRQITSNPPEDPVLNASLSPDGLYIAYADLKGVHLRLIATGEVRSLPLPPRLCFR